VKNLIWNGKKEKIKDNTIIADYNHGGIRAPDAQTQYKSLKFKQFLRTKYFKSIVKSMTNTLIGKGEIID
jgi:hypothetical protein